ncbi:MAG: hypothetical protein WAS26_09470 [Paracoccaceae bacterium]
MADLDAALMQKVFDLPKRRWEKDIYHHRQADDLGRRLEMAGRAGLGHGPRPDGTP